MVKKILGLALRLLSCALLASSVALLLLCASLLSTEVAVSLRVASLASAVSRSLPEAISFWGVISSPLGGVFRTDFALVALAALIAAKLVRKIARFF